MHINWVFIIFEKRYIHCVYNIYICYLQGVYKWFYLYNIYIEHGVSNVRERAIYI